MRVAVGGIVHETNTYAVASTSLTELDEFQCWRGSEIADFFTGTGTGIGGILEACAAGGHESVLTFMAVAEPSGTITASAYEQLKAELITSLREALPLDAVALELHGAGVAEGYDDLEADLGAAIREVVGPDVPVSAVLDLHGNITPAMAEVFDLLLGCHLYPHTDLDDRGRESVALLEDVHEGRLRPVMHVEQLPILLPTSTTDPGNPAAAANEVCAQIEAGAAVVDCTMMHGFPFTDIPEVGTSIIAIANGDLSVAQEAARAAASWVWKHRDDFRAENETPDMAVRRASGSDTGPVVINACSDNPGGGSPGDGTHLLRAMVDAKLHRACFGFISDPEVVDAAIVAGVGNTIDVKLGGKHDDIHGSPIPVTATVRCITDGRFQLQAMMRGYQLDLGPTCRLTVGGLDIVVTSKPWQTIDPEVFLLHGIDVTRYKVIGLKSSNHFRAGFRDLAAEIITADSPGLTTNRVDVFDHSRARRPLWPTDPAATYS
jgi:microcystin degradation protein MlrC